MKVYLGLHKTISDAWTIGRMYLEEASGIMCQMDDGSMVVVVSDGRVLRFSAEGLRTEDVR